MEEQWTLEELIDFLKDQWDNGVTVYDDFGIVTITIPIVVDE